MARWTDRFFYDRADRELLDELDAIARDGQGRKKHLRRLLDPYLHPRGIKELAAPRELRLVYAMHRLLAVGHEPEMVDQRLNALQTLRQELIDGGVSPLPLNAARVQLQLMKLLIRSVGDPPGRRLSLAHDLRQTLIGNPRFIRRQLRRHHLLEMPESWNQSTFDDHVHDANTKGRKTPTHLIMDAWIKGIRRLQVVYYDRIPPLAAREVLEAAAIMGIDVRIGVEFTACGGDKPVKLVWTPRGFASAGQFLETLEQEQVKEFFAPYADVEAWRKRRVLDRLGRFNRDQRADLRRWLRIDCPVLSEEAFLRYVGSGLPSLLHLAEFIHLACVERVQSEPLTAAAPAAPADAGPEAAPPAPARGTPDGAGELLAMESAEAVDTGPAPAGASDDEVAAARHALSAEAIHDRYLADAEAEERNPGPDCPEALRIRPEELARKLHALPCGCRLCLNLTGLELEDVIDILHASGGLVTHLEIFNLKDYKTGEAPDLVAINAFRQALNHGDVVRIKHTIKDALARLERIAPENEAAVERNRARRERFRAMLLDLTGLSTLYARTPLEVRLASHSTGRYRRLHGMGLAVVDSLAPSARRQIGSNRDAFREIVPVTARLARNVRSEPPRRLWLSGPDWFRRACRALNYPFGLGLEKTRSWIVEDGAARIGPAGNIATLGGYWDEPAHAGLHAHADAGYGPKGLVDGWNALDSRLLIGLKILIGLVPAALTFWLTQTWWVLVFFGAPLWLGITAVRNILQSVLGGGGWRRSELLRWDRFVSWQRVADSLMYTGISVPLLELGVRYWLLEKALGLTADRAPVTVYSVIALVNGCYIAWHNWYRGLSREAILGNFFRTVVSIPLAIVASEGTEKLLALLGAADAPGLVAQWASIISKLTSDFVAGLVEGYADRIRNIRLRLDDYRGKLRQLFAHYSRLEIMFPEEDILERLKSPKAFMKSVSKEGNTLARILIINALDLQYFWFYQPQAATAWRLSTRRLTDEEKTILIRSQYVLKKEKEVGQLFIDGLLGKNFAPALSFYLNQHDSYLKQLKAQELPEPG